MFIQRQRTWMFIELICSRAKLETTHMSANRWTDKQTVIYPHSEILPSDKEKWNIDTPHTNMHESQNHLSEWKRRKKSTESMSLFIYNFRNCELICQDTKQISGCLGINGEIQIIKGSKTVLELMEMLVILTVVMISEVYTHIRSHQDVHFKCVLFIQC